MKTSQMRTIDFLLGGAICLTLDVFERIRRIFPSNQSKPEFRSVLITKYLGMGSILLATPAIRALKNSYPECRIILLTFAENAPFVRRLPLIDDVIVIRTASFTLLACDTLFALLKIRKLHIDYLLDLEFFARYSTIISYLSGARFRVGYFMPQIWRGDLLHIPVHFNPYRHVSEIFAAQVEALGIAVTDYSISAPTVDTAAISSARQILDDNAVLPGSYIAVINVNASELSLERRWPADHFIKLMESLSARAGIRMILVGSKSEQEYVTSLFKSLSDKARSMTANISGQMNLDQFIALLSLCDICITNDSGPLHIAAALGRQTVSFFGPESPHLYGPRGSGHTIFYAGIYCSPCLNVYNAKKAMCNGNNICMRAISAEQVIDTVFNTGTDIHGN